MLAFSAIRSWKAILLYRCRNRYTVCIIVSQSSQIPCCQLRTSAIKKNANMGRGRSCMNTQRTLVDLRGCGISVKYLHTLGTSGMTEHYVSDRDIL